MRKALQKKLHFSRICCKIAFVPMQRCLSGLRSTIGNRVTGVTRPEVRILFSAPTRERPNGALFSCWRREEVERPSDSRRFARGGGGAWSGRGAETIFRRRSFRGAAEENPLKARLLAGFLRGAEKRQNDPPIPGGSREALPFSGAGQCRNAQRQCEALARGPPWGCRQNPLKARLLAGFLRGG